MSEQPPSEVPKGRARLGAERRAAIVDAAITVFAQRGFRGGALDDIAERAGLTSAGILYHFGTKEALLQAVIAERDRRAQAELSQLPIEGGLETIRAIVRFAEQSERERWLTALHSVLQAESFEPDTPAHRYFQERSRLLQQRSTETLLHAQRQGQVRPDVDCAAKARQLVAFIEGAAILWLTDGSTSLVELYREYLESLIQSIRV